MNKKKAGLVTAGVVTALLAASPLAFATEGHDAPHGPDGKLCAFKGGDAGATSEISGTSYFGNLVEQFPWAGGNEGNSGNCSEFMNNNGNGNGSGNSVLVLSPPPAAP